MQVLDFSSKFGKMVGVFGNYTLFRRTIMTDQTIADISVIEGLQADINQAMGQSIQSGNSAFNPNATPQDTTVLNAKDHRFTDASLGGQQNTPESIIDDLTGHRNLVENIIKIQSELEKQPDSLYAQENNQKLESMKNKMRDNWNVLRPMAHAQAIALKEEIAQQKDQRNKMLVLYKNILELEKGVK